MVIEKYAFGAYFIAEQSVLVRKSVIIRVIDILLLFTVDAKRQQCTVSVNTQYDHRQRSSAALL